MAPDLTKTVEDFYRAMAERDFPRLRELLDPQIEWNSAENFLYAQKNPYVGIEAVLGIQRQVDVEWDGFLVMPNEILCVVDTVIVRGRYRGRFKATGFGLDAEFVHVLKYRDAKLVMAQTYTDTAQFRDAVNHLRQPPTETMQI